MFMKPVKVILVSHPYGELYNISRTSFNKVYIMLIFIM